MASRVKTEKIIENTLTKNGMTCLDGLRALAGLVGKHHVETIGMARVGLFNDGLETTTGKQAISYADGLKNYADAIAGSYEITAEYRRSIGELDSADQYAHRASEIRCLAEILGSLLTGWEEEGEKLREKGYKPENIIS
jgi:hypothetical protein